MPIPQDPAEGTLTISDFSPGIYSNGALAATAVAAPPGAAREEGTVGCIALPGGGLGPLPSQEQTNVGPASWDASAGAPASMTAISGIGEGLDIPGFILAHSANTDRYYLYDTTNSVVVLTQWQNTGGTLYNYANSAIPAGFPYGIDINPGYSRDPAVLQRTRSHILAGFAELPASGGPAPNCTFFEYDKSGTTWKALYDPPAAGGATGQAFLFQQRNNFLTGQPSSPTFLYADETGAFTGRLDLWGFLSGDTYGMISTGEFLVISRGQGALRITGTFEYPTVVELPGVVATGAQSMRGVPSSVGLLYCVEKVGVFAWNGSNTSDFVSPQLRPDFFERATSTHLFGVGGQSVQAAKWGQWAVFPNNFFFDPTIGERGSWWRLSTVDCATFWSTDEDVLYGMVDRMALNQPLVYRWYRNFPVPYWSWQSHSLPMTPHGRMVEVHDIEIRVVPAVATAQIVTVTLTNSEGVNTVETFNFTAPATKPIRLRKPTFCKGYDIICKIEASDLTTNPAPVLHSISLAWRQSSPTSDVVTA